MRETTVTECFPVKRSGIMIINISIFKLSDPTDVNKHVHSNAIKTCCSASSKKQ
jgi:hypothetical protein